MVAYQEKGEKHGKHGKHGKDGNRLKVFSEDWRY